MSKFKIEQEYIDKIDEVLTRGLRQGLGSGTGQMCIEQAICYAMGEPLSDEPTCVAVAVRSFAVSLNDHAWASPRARADGLRDLAVSQLGSSWVVDGRKFSKVLAEKTIRILIPKLFREVFPLSPELLKAADRCEKEGTKEAVDAAYATYAYAAHGRVTRAYAAEAIRAACEDRAAHAAAYAAYAAYDAYDEYLILSARLAVETLRELRSPGCEWL